MSISFLAQHTIQLTKKSWDTIPSKLESNLSKWATPTSKNNPFTKIPHTLTWLYLPKLLNPLSPLLLQSSLTHPYHMLPSLPHPYPLDPHPLTPSPSPKSKPPSAPTPS